MGNFTFKSQGSTKPTAAGSLLQLSAYGQTIPVIYGLTQSPLLAIWAANLRQGGSVKKFKQFKKGITAYVENIDFLLGHNPVRGVLQVMVNGGNFPLAFESQTFIEGSPITISDDEFYAVVAVTAVQAYSFAVDDYGGTGPQTLTGTYEIPFWNELETGPDPTMPSGYRNFPYCYRWSPSYGATVEVDAEIFALYTFKVYYAKLTAATSLMPPIGKLKLAFEAQLGSGSEYSDAGSPFDDQQIVYPHFAGLGSSEIDLGSTGALPQLLPEVAGKWGVYSTGDGDFVDMIEDIFKSGLAQAAIDAEAVPVTTQMERGLSSYDLPGVVQYKVNSNSETFDPPIPYNLPVTAGNFLVVIACGTPSAISDSLGNSWTAVFGSGVGIQVWYTQVAVTGPDTITAAGLGTAWQLVLLEVAGVDAFDSVFEATSTAAASITTGNAPGFSDFVLAIAGYLTSDAPVSPEIPLWDLLSPVNQYGYIAGANSASGGNKLAVFERIVRNPTTLAVTIPGAHTPLGICMLSFKATQPSSFPRPLGDFINAASFDLVRSQCRANGLYGSLSMNSQSAASDWIKSLAAAANAAPVFLGDQLFLYPYSEVSTAGNGAQYTAPTASGPVAALSDLNGDFVGSAGVPLQTTTDRIGQPNVLQMQCIDRNTNYNQIIVQQPDAGSIALYGVRKADPVVNNAVQDPTVARTLLAIQVRRNQYGGESWAFKASARWSLLSPMDLITLTDTLQNIIAVPVRITAWSEQADGSWSGTAEPFVYGMCAPTLLSTTSPTVNPSPIGTSAGDVNPPVIFEPTPGLYPSQTGDQIWLVISSPSEEYGGAQVYVSTDGGSSYNPVPGLGGTNIAMGNATTGVLSAEWPAGADPDSTNNLEVDLTESNGVLASYPTTAENNFEYPCYVEAETVGLFVNAAAVAAGEPLEVQVNGAAIADLGTLEVNTTAVAGPGASGFNYELMTYAVATLTAASKYTLMATGSGNFLRRAVLDAPNAMGMGVDHANGSRFAFLSPANTGILKMAMPTVYVGQQLFFKILSFNQFGSALQSLADVTAYSYTPTGIPGSA
jgi:hypothetical protein